MTIQSPVARADARFSPALPEEPEVVIAESAALREDPLPLRAREHPHGHELREPIQRTIGMRLDRGSPRLCIETQQKHLLLVDLRPAIARKRPHDRRATRLEAEPPAAR